MLFAVQEFNIRLKSTLICMEHFCYTITGKRCTCYGIYLRRWVFDLLFNSKCYLLSIVSTKEMLTLEQILPCLVVFDFSTETSSLTLVVEVSTKDGSLITIDSDETIDRSLKTVTINRDNILIFTVYLATEQSEFAFLGILTIQLKAGINATLLPASTTLPSALMISSAMIICFQSLTASSLLISRF